MPWLHRIPGASSNTCPGERGLASRITARILHPTSRTPRPAGSPGSPRAQQQPRGQLPAGLTQTHPQHDGHADSDSGRRTRAVTPLQAEPSQHPAVPRTDTSPRGPAAPNICPLQRAAGAKPLPCDAHSPAVHTHTRTHTHMCTHTHVHTRAHSHPRLRARGAMLPARPAESPGACGSLPAWLQPRGRRFGCGVPLRPRPAFSLQSPAAAPRPRRRGPGG